MERNERTSGVLVSPSTKQPVWTRRYRTGSLSVNSRVPVKILSAVENKQRKRKLLTFILCLGVERGWEQDWPQATRDVSTPAPLRFCLPPPACYLSYPATQRLFLLWQKGRERRSICSQHVERHPAHSKCSVSTS